MMMKKILVALPAKAQDLENALHSARDSGHWDGEVRLVRTKDVDSYQDVYRLELVYDDNAGLCPYSRRVFEGTNGKWHVGCAVARDKDEFSTPCTNCGRLPCERYEKHKEDRT